MNPYIAGPLCGFCNDIRWVSTRPECRKTDLVRCPKCGPDSDSDKHETESSKERYADFCKRRWAEQQKPVGISQLDLTDDELNTFRHFKATHGVSSLTALAWMEGQRYDPTKDEEFLVEARQKFKEWKRR
jgi:hypothetical protein